MAEIHTLTVEECVIIRMAYDRIDLLTPEQRRIVTDWINGMTQAEIAEDVGISQQSVSLILKFLKKSLNCW